MKKSAAYQYSFFHPVVPKSDFAWDFVQREFSNEDPKLHRTMYGIIQILRRDGGVAMPRGKNYYRIEKRGQVSHKVAVASQDLLKERGLIDILRGYPASMGFKKGISTKLKPTDAFEYIFDQLDVSSPIIYDREAHPAVTLDKLPFTRTLFSDYDDLKRPVTSNEIWRTAATVERLNKGYFSELELTFLAENPEDVPNFSGRPFFTSMFSREGDGRLYQRAPSYQNMRSSDREKLLLNDKLLVELDYPSMHINLAYGMMRTKNPFPSDSYTPIIDEISPAVNDPELRSAVKKAVIIGFNTPNVHKLIQAYRYGHKHELEVLKRHGIDGPDRIYREFLRLNPELAPLFNQDKIASKEIMFYESRVMLTILETLEKRGIEGLPLHDAVLLPSTETLEVGEIMNDAFERITGNTIEVKVK